LFLIRHVLLLIVEKKIKEGIVHGFGQAMAAATIGLKFKISHLPNDMYEKQKKISYVINKLVNVYIYAC